MEKKQKILVVEDDSLVSKNTQEFLTEEGFDVICVLRGRDAITVCEEDFAIFDIDLVLMDGDLGKSSDINGFEAAQMIKRICSSLPIICISGKDIPDKYRKCFAAHCKKPFSFDQLVPLIRKTLQKS